MKRGLLIVLSGPSGVGKGTVRNELMKRSSLRLFYSISMTTRSPRQGEREGVDYYFVTREDFARQVEEGNLLEWAEFVGNCYGTPKDKVEEKLAEGYNVLLEIETNGALSVMSKCPEALTIFLVPPSLEDLEARIRGRRTESEEIIQSRLAKARKELELEHRYQYVVINDEVSKAAERIAKIIEKAQREG